MLIKINNLNDLTDLKKQTRWVNRPLVNKVNINLGNQQPGEIRRLEKKLKNLLNDCGCQYGVLFLVITFLASFLPQIIKVGFTWRILLFSIAISFAAAILGKLFGLFLSYRKLQSLYRKISSNISKNHQI